MTQQPTTTLTSPTAQTSKEIEQGLDYYRNNPEAFIKDHIGVEHIDNQQLEVITAYRNIILAKEKKARREYRLLHSDPLEVMLGMVDIPTLTDEEETLAKKMGILVRAPKGVGKTTVLAWLIIHFMCCFGKNQKNLATAPKYDLLMDNLFPEIVRWIQNARKFFGEGSWVYSWLGEQKGKIFRKAGMAKDEIGDACVTLARTSKQNASSSERKATLSGYHSEYQLIPIDECYGVHDDVFEALVTTLTRAVNFAILIGNPTTNIGFANKAWGSPYWTCVQMTSEGSTLVTKEYIERMKEQYKNFPNMLRVYLHGLPPEDEEDAIMQFSKIVSCMELELELTQYENEPVVGGMDVGMGGDSSCICIRQGMDVPVVIERKCKDTGENVDFARHYILTYNPLRFGVDAIGVGKGVYDNLKAEFPDVVRAVISSNNAVRQDIYANKRAELLVTLANKVNAVGLRLPNSDPLKAELSIIRLLKDKHPMQIVSKREMRSQGIASPNMVDSIAITMDFNDEHMKNTKKFEEDYAYHRSTYDVGETSFMSA